MADNGFIIENSTETIFVEAQENHIATNELTTNIVTDDASPLVSEIEEVSPVNIAVGEVSGVSAGTRIVVDHNASNPNQHTIGAITGLREELDDIKSLKTIYSDKPLHADYYAWEGGISYDEYGYFVSFVPGTSNIKICDGSDIFGVSVDSAGFIGGQDEIAARGNSYALVVTTGLVDVICESNVSKGDYVISNKDGIAAKTTSTCGYKVIAVNEKYGILYASIALGVQACTTDSIGKNVHYLETRVENNEINIASAINVANEAYKKANECIVSNGETSDKVDDALGVIDGVVSDVENMGTQLESSALISAQAKAIAESAATSAESMRNEAVEKANEALAETSELRKELESTVVEMEIDLENAALELEATKENLEITRDNLQSQIDETVKNLGKTDKALETTRDELSTDIKDAIEDIEELSKDLTPLAEWPSGSENPTGIAGFVARADKDSATLASMVTWRGDAGDSLAGFVQEATEENATVSAIASYQRKDADGNPIGEPGAAGLMAQVDANKSELEAVASYEKNGAKGLAGLVAQVDANKSELNAVASYEKDGAKGLAGLVAQVGSNKSELSTVASYEKDGKKGLAGLTAQVDANKSELETVASYKTGDAKGLAGLAAQVDANKSELSTVASYEKDGAKGLAGLKAQVDENKSELSAVVSYKKDDMEGIAGLVAQVDANKSELSTVASYNKNGKSGLAGLAAYVDEHETSVSTLAQYEQTDSNGNVLSRGATGLIAQVEANKSSIDLLAKLEGDGYDGLAGLVGRVDANTAELKNIASHTYTDNNGNTKTGLAAIDLQVTDQGTAINDLAYWQDDANIAMARIEQKADANGAYIQSTVSNMDKYSVGPYSQAQGFTLDQAKAVLENGMVYVPTVSHSKETYNPDYSFTVNNTYTWSGETWTEAVGQVVFSGTMPSGNAYPLWYTNSDTVTSGYEPYTLYKYCTYDAVDDNGDATTESRWEPVATLKGNSSNRAVSQIRQDANSIELSVTTLDNKYAGTKTWVDANKSAIQDTVKWKSENAESIATFMQEAGDNFASATQVAKIVDEDGNIKAASIVTAVNESGSSVVIDADHINLNGYVTVTDLSTEEKTEIHGSNIATGTLSASQITTGILNGNNYTYESGTYAKSGMGIDLDNGVLRSKNFAIDKDGNAYFTGSIEAKQIKITDLSAFGATIGGWTIGSGGITKNTVGLMSDNSLSYQSLITSDTSPVRMYSGAGYSETSVQAVMSLEFDGEGKYGSNSVKLNLAGSIVSARIVSIDDPDGYVHDCSITHTTNTISIDASGEAYADFMCDVTYEYTYTYADNNKKMFMVLEDGSVYANGVSIRGTINAQGGTIGGWTIEDGALYSHNRATSLYGSGNELMQSISSGGPSSVIMKSHARYPYSRLYNFGTANKCNVTVDDEGIIDYKEYTVTLTATNAIEDGSIVINPDLYYANSVGLPINGSISKASFTPQIRSITLSEDRKTANIIMIMSADGEAGIGYEGQILSVFGTMNVQCIQHGLTYALLEDGTVYTKALHAEGGFIGRWKIDGDNLTASDTKGRTVVLTPTGVAVDSRYISWHDIIESVENDDDLVIDW